jgi:hypothetical protein
MGEAYPIGAAETTIECQDAEHRLRWVDGVFSTPDHDDPDGERAMIALGGPACPCLTTLDRWLRHADDLDVLLLASRGPSDVLENDADRPRRGSRGGARRTGGPATGGWYAYGPLSWVRTPPGSPSWLPDEPADEVSALLALGDGLAHRLVATVVATWTARIEAVDPRVEPVRPDLTAALYGRALAAFQGWLGPEVQAEVVMVAPGIAAGIEATGDLAGDAGPGMMTARLPFRWLHDVWVPELATMLGRFTLAADTAPDGTRTLIVVGADTGGPRTVVLDGR